MMRKSEEAIMSASNPRDIFSMNPETIEQEKDEYINRFKPEAYSTIKNFMIAQKVTLLYRQALSELGNNEYNEYSLNITNLHGETRRYECHYIYDIKLGKMYVTEDFIIFIINKKYKSYYENYISKTKKFPKFDKKLWSNIEYMLPNVSNHFETKDGNFAIFVSKPPCKIYPLREILNYYGGKLKPEYVASILTRLYNFEAYMELAGMNHNGIILDNLFFAAGKTVDEGQPFTIDDMRIVGVFGGWFFTTTAKERLKGLPKEVHELLSKEMLKFGYSSFEVDELSIKRLGRELLGDVSGGNLGEIPETLDNWVNSNISQKNAYEEFCAWERVVHQSFNGHRFVEMDVSIN